MSNRLDGKEEREQMKKVRAPVCSECAHWKVGTENCKAFPKGIPDAIFLYGDPHRKPFPGDRGVRFEPMPPDGRA